MRKNKILIIIINIVVFISLFFVIDDLIYRFFNNVTYKYLKSEKEYLWKNPPVYFLDYNLAGRQVKNPENINIKYKNNPIVLFGCSFAYGQNLDDNQTFGYKLSAGLKRPVINRAIKAGSLQHMYYQSTLEQFYKDIPFSDNVVYIMIDDQTRRTFIYSFYINIKSFYLHYSVKNNELIMDNYSNPILNFLKSLYIVKVFNHFYVNLFIKNVFTADKLTDIELLYFIKTRENLEKHWKTKVKFTVIIYNWIPWESILVKKLKKNGFNVIVFRDLKNIDIKSNEYMSEDFHPKEAAWNVYVDLCKDLIK